MAKYVTKQLESIQQTIAQYPAGVVIEDIHRVLDFSIERRSLQRRLKQLCEEGKIRMTGGSHATRYVANKPLPYDSAIADQVVNESNHIYGSEIPLSEEARRILSAVNVSVQKRNPVGYNHQFLENYIPNHTTYLSTAEKAKLAETGRTSNSVQAAGTYAKHILNRLLIDLSWNSSRLEGTPYSLLETQKLIALGEEAEGKSIWDAQMILNHKEAIEFLVEAADEIKFDRYTITNLHALLAQNLLPDPGATGRLRHIQVRIGGSVYEPLGIPQKVEAQFELMLNKAEQIEDPFEQAFFIMVHLPYLQPFDDVNKRVSRLAANIPLNQHNLAPLSFVDVPEKLYTSGLLGVYELNKTELYKDVFMWAYERSAARYAAIQQSLGQPDTFRLQYRNEIRQVVGEIVVSGMDYREAAKKIEEIAARIVEGDRKRLVEAVETELLSLHEGNIARYRIRPSQFQTWKERWKLRGYA